MLRKSDVSDLNGVRSWDDQKFWGSKSSWSYISHRFDMSFVSAVSLLVAGLVIFGSAICSEARRSHYHTDSETMPIYYRKSNNVQPMKSQYSPAGNKGVIVGADILKIFGIRPGGSFRELLSTVAANFLLLFDIILKQVARGAENVMKNLMRHDDGKINVPAESQLGTNLGNLANSFLGMFLVDRWNGIVSHIVQESIDRFIAGSNEFFNQMKLIHS